MMSECEMHCCLCAGRVAWTILCLMGECYICSRAGGGWLFTNYLFSARWLNAALGHARVWLGFYVLPDVVGYML